MTQMATTNEQLSIPAAGLTHTAGDVTVRAFYVNAAGYKIEVRIDGAYQPHLSSLHTFETGPDGAIAAYTARVAEATPAAVEPAPAARLTPAAKGSQTYMSPAEVDLILDTLTSGTNLIVRGRGTGRADIKQLQALARRPFAQLVGPQFRPTGAVITSCGALTALALDAQRRAAADRDARIAHVLATTAA